MSAKLTKMRLGEGLEKSRTDWKKINRLSDCEIARAIAGDPDTIDPGPEWLATASLPKPMLAKERLTVRFDADMVEWFRRQGRGYQTRMNAILRAYFEHTRHKR
jgi:uncharacterized protein (DUF4415 family)